MPEARTIDITAKRERKYRQPAAVHRRTMAIVRAYQKGESAAIIGRRFGISGNAVYQSVGRLRRKIQLLASEIEGGAELLIGANKAHPAPGLDQIIKSLNLLKKNQGEKKRTRASRSAR